MKKITKVSVLALVVVMLMSVVSVSAASTTPTNLLPADILTSADKADDYFTNVSTNAEHYSYADYDYVMRVPESAKGTNWIATKDTITYSSYTVSVDIRPVAYTSGSTTKLGGAALLLGTSGNTNFPWHCIRFNFSASDGTVSFFGFEHKGSAYGYMDEPNYTVIRTGVNFEEKEWFTLTVEVTPEGSTVYLDGEKFLEERNARLPDSSEIKWVGLYPEGGSAGFDAKDFQITDKASSAKLLPEDLFTAAKASQHLTRVDAASYSKDGGTVPMMRVPLVANGNGWIQSKMQIPYTSYTVSYDFSMVARASDGKLGGVGNIVGFGNRTWYSLRFDADVTNGRMQLRVVELGSTLAVKEDLGYVVTGLDFSEKLWFNIKYEVTADSFKVFLDGQELTIPYIAGKLSSQNIQYFGFFPEGGTDGFDIKNLGLYEGVSSNIEEEPSSSPSTNPEGGTQEPNQPTGDVSIIASVMVLLVGVAFIVIRKRACAE